MSQTVRNLTRSHTFGSSSIRARQGDPLAETADKVLVYPLAQPLDVRGVDEDFRAVLLDKGDALFQSSGKTLTQTRRG